MDDSILTIPILISNIFPIHPSKHMHLSARIMHQNTLPIPSPLPPLRPPPSPPSFLLPLFALHQKKSTISIPHSQYPQRITKSATTPTSPPSLSTSHIPISPYFAPHQSPRHRSDPIAGNGGACWILDWEDGGEDGKMRMEAPRPTKKKGKKKN